MIVRANRARRRTPAAAAARTPRPETPRSEFVPTKLNVTQQFDAPPATVYGLFADQGFQEGRLDEVGGLEAQVVSLDATDDGVKIVTRQNIPSSVLPSMVASMIPGDPATERIEDWHVAGDGYSADFSVTSRARPRRSRARWC